MKKYIIILFICILFIFLIFCDKPLTMSSACGLYRGILDGVIVEVDIKKDSTFSMHAQSLNYDKSINGSYSMGYSCLDVNPWMQVIDPVSGKKLNEPIVCSGAIVGISGETLIISEDAGAGLFKVK